MRSLLPAVLILAAAAVLPAEDTPAKRPASAKAPKELTVPVVLDRMETARRKLKTFRAEVVKTRKVEVLDLTEKFVGNIQFKMPRLLRLELRNVGDGKEIIYIVGRKYGWIYRPQQKQAERGELRNLKDASEQANPLEYGLARDIHELRKFYDIKILPPEEVEGTATVPLQLDPKGGADYDAGRLVFWIDTKRWLPMQVREFKSNGEIIETHTFSDIRINMNIPDETFEFTPPPDVDVIIHEPT